MGDYSKYEWAASDIFDLVTYDAGLDENFVKKILEVCGAILNNETFDYIRDEKQYTDYIIVCQLLDKFDWINWGTSIRGAWFEPGRNAKQILEEFKWINSEGTHIIKAVPFTVENLRDLIKFMEE